MFSVSFHVSADKHTTTEAVGRTVLWALRVAAIGLGRRLPVEDPLVKILRPLGVADAAGQIQAFVLILAHGASRRIDLDCVCQRTVSADERRLIAVLALVQHARCAEAASLLRPLVRASAVAAALDSGARLMASFSSAGQRLQPPNSIMQVECRLRAPTAPDEPTETPITVH